jgi:hypothetical protein
MLLQQQKKHEPLSLREEFLQELNQSVCFPNFKRDEEELRNELKKRMIKGTLF